MSWGGWNISKLLVQHPQNQNHQKLLRGAKARRCQQDANKTKSVSSKQRVASAREV